MNRIGLVSVLLLALAGQARADGWNGDAVVGGALGGATGAAIGSALGGRDAAIIGGILGGAAGVAVATRDHDYRRPGVVHHRPAPLPHYRQAPARRVYERHDYGPPHGHPHYYRQHGPRHQHAYHPPYGGGPRHGHPPPQRYGW